MPTIQEKPKTKAQAWAEKDAEGRAKLYLSMRSHLHDVAALLKDPGEGRILRQLAREFGGVAARVKTQVLLDEACCHAAVTFGSCRCPH